MFGGVESAVPVTVFLYLSRILTQNRQYVVDMAVGKDVEDTTRGEASVRILHLLADATAKEECFERLRSNTPFLEVAVKVLNEIQENKPVKFDLPGREEVIPDGSFMVRQELIRLITNMCAGNRHHQDKVRILGGVTTILCHCVVDKQNPYMPQWSIMAIRMLTHKNKENQSIINNLRNEGVVQDEALRKLGVEIKMDGSKPRAAVVHPQSDENLLKLEELSEKSQIENPEQSEDDLLKSEEENFYTSKEEMLEEADNNLKVSKGNFKDSG